MLVGRGATKESVDDEKPEPISRASEDRLVVDSVDNEELVRDDEPVPSPVPVIPGFEVRADDDFVNNEGLVDYAAGNFTNNEDLPISCAFKEGLFVESVNDEELIHNNEPVASLAPVG